MFRILDRLGSLRKRAQDFGTTETLTTIIFQNVGYTGTLLRQSCQDDRHTGTLATYSWRCCTYWDPWDPWDPWDQSFGIVDTLGLFCDKVFKYLDLPQQIPQQVRCGPSCPKKRPVKVVAHPIRIWRLSSCLTWRDPIKSGAITALGYIIWLQTWILK